MKNLLVVNSSPNFETSISRKLTNEFMEQWKAAFPTAKITMRDVARNPVPHLDQETIGAFYTPDESKSADQKKIVSLSDVLVDEILSADTIVIGAPMHNFSISSTLKSYFDQIARVGKTFNYTSNGPVGALGDKKIYILVASGGKYSKGSPAEAMNMLEPVVKTFLGFLGAKDVIFIYGEGASMGEEEISKNIKSAKNTISKLVRSAA